MPMTMTMSVARWLMVAVLTGLLCAGCVQQRETGKKQPLPAQGKTAEQGKPVTEGEVSCPASVSTRQALAKPVPGWNAEQQGASHALENVEFFYGSPVGPNLAEPVSKVKLADGVQEVYSLGPFPENEPARTLVCNYLDTDVIYSRTLSRRIKRCTVTYPASIKMPSRIFCE